MKVNEIISKILDVNLPLILEINNEVISEDFILKHHSINKVVIFINCCFERNIYLQYTILKQSIKFDKCKFNGQVIWGDDSKYETVSLCEKDIHFNESFFLEKVNFTGMTCLGSLFFTKCRFLFIPSQITTLQEYGVIIAESSFNNSVIFEQSVLRGGINLNSSKFGIGVTFFNVKFYNKKSIIDFVGANFGKALQMQGCYFECNEVCLESISTELYFNLSPKYVFQIKKDDFLKIKGNTKKIRQEFAKHGIYLKKHIFIKQVGTTASEDNKIVECEIVTSNSKFIFCEVDGFINVSECTFFNNISAFNISYSKIGKALILDHVLFNLNIAKMNNIVCSEIRCLCLSGNISSLDMSYSKIENFISFDNSIINGDSIDLSNITCRDIKCIDTKLIINDTIDFRHTKLGWIFNCTSSYIKSKLITLNGASCLGGAFFIDTKFESIEKKREESDDPEDINLSFCFFGNNLQFRNLTFINNTWIELNSTKIGDSFIIENLKTDKDFIYLRLNDSQTNKFIVYSLNKTLFDFDGFKFDIYSEHLSWNKLAKYQSGFSEDIYIQFEKFYLTKGDTEKAQKIYYKGRCAHRKNQKRKRGFKYIFSREYFFDTFLKYSVGYGVKLGRLLTIITTFIIIGAWVQYHYLYAKISFFICIQQSIIHFFPIGGFIDVNIAHHIKPNVLYNSYFIFHKIAGFILIPFYIATLTGFVKKKAINYIILLFVVTWI